MFQRSSRLPSSSSLVGSAWHPSFTPEGGELLQIDLDGSNLRSLTSYAETPILSPDGTMVAYARGEQIVILTLEDRLEKSIAHVCGLDDYRITWSSDSKTIAFESEEVLFENGAVNGCRFGNAKFMAVHSIGGNQIAEVSYREVQGYQDWQSNRPRYAFSPDSDWLSVVISYRTCQDPILQITSSSNR